jgi:hypothetical protein
MRRMRIMKPGVKIKGNKLRLKLLAL